MDTGNPVIDAQSAFAREQRRRRRNQALHWLLRRPHTGLVPLDCALGSEPPARQTRVGVRTIPLESIVGTAEAAKQRTFDADFRPPSTSRERWQRLWMAGRSGRSLPPISVFRVGDQHYVEDGHHRVSVAHSLGMAAIDAEVTELGKATKAFRPKVRAFA
jgi:hypothetical protein